MNVEYMKIKFESQLKLSRSLQPRPKRFNWLRKTPNIKKTGRRLTWPGQLSRVDSLKVIIRFNWLRKTLNVKDWVIKKHRLTNKLNLGTVTK
jgi:hypothetical protein